MKNSILLVLVISAVISATSAYPQWTSSDLQLLSEIQDILAGVQDDGGNELDDILSQGSELQDIDAVQDMFNRHASEQGENKEGEGNLAMVLAALQDDDDDNVDAQFFFGSRIKNMINRMYAAIKQKLSQCSNEKQFCLKFSKQRHLPPIVCNRNYSSCRRRIESDLKRLQNMRRLLG